MYRRSSCSFGNLRCVYCFAVFANQQDRTMWPMLKQRLTEVFATKTQAEWCQIMEGTDVCFAPVLTMSEAARHPHNVARKTFIEVDGQ